MGDIAAQPVPVQNVFPPRCGTQLGVWCWPWYACLRCLDTAMAAFQREHAYVAQAFDPSTIPDHKLAENQLPTKNNQDLYAAATT